MLQVDLAKAFDRVSHSYLFSLLEHANVGSIVFKGVRLCYTHCSTRLVINDHLSKPVDICSSVKQGCPMSPLHFALYLEPLCLSVIQSSSIHGFNILGNEVKVLAYADDLAFFCTDKPSVEKVVATIEKFGSVSGAQMNSLKSLGLWFGSWCYKPEQFAGIKWTNFPPTYLGLLLDAYKLSAHYWKERVSALQSYAQTFVPYRLSIFGKAEACNKFLPTKIYYVLQVIHCARL